MMTQVSFPGLFDKSFTIDPVAIRFTENFGVRWYGLLICIGIILAVLNTVRNAKKEGISEDDVMDYALWGVPFAIVGARLYYVLTTLDNGNYRSFYDVIAIWNGGIAVYGSIIGGAIAVFVVSRVKKQSFISMADAVAPSLLIGQFIGRWGNFCNGEAFGHLDRFELLGKVIPTPGFAENYPLRMAVCSPASGGAWLTVHPTFLYESLWNFLGFILLTLLYRKKKYKGEIILGYTAWYGFGRFFVEGLRADSLLIPGTGVRISQLLALVTFIVSAALLILLPVLLKRKSHEETEYVPQFSGTALSDDPSAAAGEEAAEAEAAPKSENSSDGTIEKDE